MELNAINLFHLFCKKAPAVPAKLDSNKTTIRKKKILSKKQLFINEKTNLINNPKIAILGITAKKAVIGLTQPSYTSGNQK